MVELTVWDLAEQFGVPVDELLSVCSGLSKGPVAGLEYSVLPDQPGKVGKLLREIDEGRRQASLAPTATMVAQGYDQDWSRRESLLRNTGNLAYTSLRDTEIMRDPAGNRVLRLMGRYVLADVRFESRWFGILREWVARSYLAQYPLIIEFGTGGGENLVAISSIFPDKHFIGLDRSPASASMVSYLGEMLNLDIVGGVWDMERPSDTSFMWSLGNAAVLTVNALEQLGTGWEPFFDYLVESGPGIIVHIEPIIEWYDPENLFDVVAIHGHRSSRYLNGYVRRVMELEQKGRAEIIKAKRTHMGPRNQDSYGVLVWRPCG